MSRGARCRTAPWILAAGGLALLSGPRVRAAWPPDSTVGDGTVEIDLPMALRLAGARSLDVRIALGKLAEARANHLAAIERVFPGVSPGLAYRRHGDLTQATDGGLVDVEKEATSSGVTASVQADLGGALYGALEAGALASAAEHALDAERDASLVGAVQDYFDLLKSQAAVDIARDAVAVAREYSGQIDRAVDAGIAFRGDALRVQVQAVRAELNLEQAIERRGAAAARLAATLRLGPGSAPHADPSDLVPMALVDAGVAADSLVDRALEARPEARHADAQAAAARHALRGATLGPLLPALGLQAFVGSLDGGPRDGPEVSGHTEDYAATLGWRIGPGGLFDVARIRAAGAREDAARYSSEKVADEIRRQVVESSTRVRSRTSQVELAKRELDAAEEALRISRQRSDFGIAAVLERILAEQDLMRARTDYAGAIADLNTAQYALLRAIGDLERGP